MKQRILVLGAGGFIGRQVVDALSASDWATPLAAIRRTPSATQGALIRLDATDPGQVRAALQDVAGVVNCVAGNPTTIVAGARALFESAAAMQTPPRVVHLSTMAVYGELTGPVEETAAPGPSLSPYGAAKFEAERLAGGGNVTVLRLGIVYGPGSAQWSGRIAEMLDARRLGDLGGAGDGLCNLTYVDDAVEAIGRCLRAPHAVGRTYNIAGAQFPTWNEYLTRFGMALGAVPIRRITRRRLKIETKLLAPPLKIAEILAGKVAPQLRSRLPQPMPSSLVRLFGQEIRMVSRPAEQELGLTWTPMDTGLAAAVRWYRGAGR